MQFAEDFTPLVPLSVTDTCNNYTRAYLRLPCSALMKPLVSACSYTTIFTSCYLMKQVRQAIMDDNLLEFPVSILWKNMAIISGDVISKMEYIKINPKFS